MCTGQTTTNFSSAYQVHDKSTMLIATIEVMLIYAVCYEEGVNHSGYPLSGVLL